MQNETFTCMACLPSFAKFVWPFFCSSCCVKHLRICIKNELSFLSTPGEYIIPQLCYCISPILKWDHEPCVITLTCLVASRVDTSAFKLLAWRCASQVQNGSNLLYEFEFYVKVHINDPFVTHQCTIQKSSVIAVPMYGMALHLLMHYWQGFFYGFFYAHLLWLCARPPSIGIKQTFLTMQVVLVALIRGSKSCSNIATQY